MLLSDTLIRGFADQHGMIEPFEPTLVKVVQRDNGFQDRAISYGTSSYGYDIRVADEYEVFAPNYEDGGIVDPKRFDPKLLRTVSGLGYCIIPPNSFALARTVEYFRIPRNILAVCLGKSTYARTGLIVNVTPFEPEWEGHVTLELSNTTPLPIKVYSNEGIAQVLFHLQPDHLICHTSYRDRNGKYQGQQGVTPPRL